MTAYPLPSIQNYENFDLLIDPTVDGYQARVINSPVGQAITQFNLDVRISDQGDPKQVGALLYQTVFSGNVGICLRRSLDAVAQQPNSGLRIRLRLTTVPELATLPWETLYDAERNLFFALSAQTPLVRYQELDQGELPLQAALPLRLLVLISDPVDFWPRLDVEHEWQQLHSAMDDLVARGKVQIERLPARLDLLQQRMQQSPVHLLHFVSHGWYDNAEHNGLIMETESGQADRVAVERLTALLHDHAALRLVFLNACEGARGDHTNALAGVAQRLVQQGIPAVIAMQKEVSDQSAIALTQTFYQALAAGSPVDAALAEARKAIFAISNNHEWSTPALFSRAVDNQLFDLLDVLPPPPCPYPGMVPFTKNDARFFFGREDEIAELRHLLRHHNQLFVIGPSGSGKSSLVFAGLLPTLEKQSAVLWRIRTFRPGATPLAALDEVLAERFSGTSSIATTSDNKEKFLLVIDQFEEIFSQASNADQTAFIAKIKALRQEQQMKLLITMRADFYPDLMNSDLWPIDVGQRLEIAPLRGEKLRQAIEQPAANVGVRLEAGLLERLLADAADEPGVLPLLQETMVLLWEGQERRVLPMAAYTRLGQDERSGLAVAMSTKADATLASLAPEQQVIARRIFLRLVQFGEGRPDTRRQQSLTDLRSVTNDMSLFDDTIQRLADNRLLTFSGEPEDTERKIDIAHEMLIVGWPTSQEWVRQRREAELTRRRLEEKAREWMRLGQGTGGLLDSDELAEAERWLQSADANDLGYNEVLDTLVQHSRHLIEAAASQKAAAHQRELEQAQQLAAEQAARADAERQRTISEVRRALIFRWATVIVTLLLLIAVGFAWWGFRNLGVANKRTNEAQNAAKLERARALTSAAQLEKTNSSHQMRAWLLAIEALKITDTVEAYSVIDSIDPHFPHSLINLDLAGNIWNAQWNKDERLILSLGKNNATGIWDVISGTRLLTVTHEGDVIGVQWNKDESRILSWGTDKVIKVWDIKDGKILNTLIHEGVVHGARWNKDETLILSWDDNTISVWDVVSSKRLLTLAHEELIGVVYWNKDESRILSLSWDGTIKVWDTTSGANQLILSHKDAVEGASWNKDESRILSWSWDGTIKVWDAISGANWLTLNQGGVVRGTQWNKNENRIISWSDNGIAIWDALSGERIIKFVHKEHIGGIQLSKDESRVLSWSEDNTIGLWDVASGERILTVVHDSDVNGAQWSKDESRILSWSEDGTVAVWDVASGELILTVVHDSVVNGARWNEDESRILSWGWDGILKVWDATSGGRLPTLADGSFSFASAWWNKDESRILAWSEDGTVGIWDAATGQRLLTLPHKGRVSGAQWNKDESRIISWSEDGTVGIWDAATGQRLLTLLHQGAVSGAQWNKDESRIFSWSLDGRVHIWGAVNGKHLLTSPQDAPVNAVEWWVDDIQWSEDGHSVLTWGLNRPVEVWDVDKGDRMFALPNESSGYGAQWNSDETRILTWAQDIDLWDSASGKHLLIFLHDNIANDIKWSYVNGIQWNKNESQILSWGGPTDNNGAVNVWDAMSGEPLLTLLHNRMVYGAQWSKDESLILSWSEDGTVGIWDATSGRRLLTLMHEDAVNGARWNKDETLILSWSSDRTARIWNAQNGKLLRLFSYNGHGIYDVLWNKDESQIMLMTKQILRYYTRREDVIRSACASATRNLTIEEWQLHLPGETYQKTCPNLPVYSKPSWPLPTPVKRFMGRD